MKIGAGYKTTKQITRQILTLLSLTVGIATAMSFAMVRPVFSSANVNKVNSFPELYKLRDRLTAELEAKPVESQSHLPFASPATKPVDAQLLEDLQAVELKILLEKRAEDSWKNGLNLGGKAAQMGLVAKPTLDTRQEEQFLWRQAINSFQEIPDNSFLADKAKKKITEYEDSWQLTMEQVEILKSGFLEKIRAESGLSRRANITVCDLDNHCLRLRGDQLPASPASLIKVPVAVALMHKVVEDGMSLDTPVLVTRDNLTEDATSDIQIRNKYPIKTLMDRMIDRSSNIATNQLIDFLGQDYINQVLGELGYPNTKVKYKLVGDRIKPRNAGKGKNTITTDELTSMMVKIYSQDFPGADVLVDALANQHDRVLGFAGVKDTGVKWLGEKTGENSRALGTTVAVDVNNEIYIITVIDSFGGRDPQIRKCINKIASYLASNGL
jgi:beta-lactamase class A